MEIVISDKVISSFTTFMLYICKWNGGNETRKEGREKLFIFAKVFQKSSLSRNIVKPHLKLQLMRGTK